MLGFVEAGSEEEATVDAAGGGVDGDLGDDEAEFTGHLWWQWAFGENSPGISGLSPNRSKTSTPDKRDTALKAWSGFDYRASVVRRAVSTSVGP